MSTTMRHPDPATLLSFAAASLPEPLAAVVAAHLDMCPQCRAEVADLDLLGAALLTETPAIDHRAFVAPQRPADSAHATRRRHVDPTAMLPASLCSAFGLSFETIPWKRLGPGIMHHRLPLSPGVGGDLRLLRIAPGRTMPDHGHRGSELTLVLEGAFCDATGSYRRGDVQDVDETIEHTPVTDARVGCICLIASEKPARFKSLVGRLVQPWTGM